MAKFMTIFLVLLPLLASMLKGVSIIRDVEDTIILDDSDWNICLIEAPIAVRDFRLTKVQGCFNGQAITGTENPGVVIVYESRNVSMDYCSITLTLVWTG